MRRLVALVFLLTILLILITSPAAPAAVTANECTLCHGTTVSDFDVPLMSRTSQCGSCHERAWHAQWNDPVTGSTTAAIYVPGIGYFKNTSTVQSTATNLHSFHSGNNSYAGRVDCNQCHGVASCSACHTNVNHNGHSTTAYAPVGFNQADGTKYSLTSSSCALSSCHQKMPLVVKTNTNGSQLCENCHPRFGATAKNLNGHDPIATETKHDADLPTTINVAAIPTTVNCNGCHNTNLVTEHNNRNKDCATCHNNIALPPVGTVVKSAQGLQANRACDKCHFNLSVIPAPTEHTLFHIATNSNNLRIDGAPHTDCNTCHNRTTPLTVSVSVYGVVYQKTLAEVASVTPKNYSCLDCHNGNSNPKAPVHKAEYNGQATNLLDVHADCSFCHAPGTVYAAKVDTIAANLKVNPTTTYSCTDCHVNLNTSHNAYYQFGTETINLNSTKYHRSCAVCHGNAKVSGVITLLKGSTAAYNCNQCHDGKAAKLALHTTATSEAIVGYHPGDAVSSRCDKCHGQANFTKINIPTWPVSYECTNCHNSVIAANGYHQAKADINANPEVISTTYHKACATCHGNSLVQPVINNLKGKVTAPYLCSECHNTTLNLAPNHKAKMTVNDTVYSTITDYHLDATGNTACGMCHGSAKLSAGTIATLKTMPSYLCDDCHKPGTVIAYSHTANFGTDAVNQKTTDYHQACQTCHDSAQAKPNIKGLIGQPVYDCTQCHDGKVTYKALHQAKMDTVSGAVYTVGYHPDCLTCHKSTNTNVINFITTNKGAATSYMCSDCHGDLMVKHQSTSDLTSTMNMVNCSWCHTSNEPAYATNNLIGVHIKTSLTLSKSYDCNVCHGTASPVKTQVTNKQTACDACHNGTSAPKRHPDTQYYPKHVVSPFPTFMPEYSPNCTTCHTNNSLITLHADPQVNVGCTTCHFTEPYKPAVVSLNANCTGCHATGIAPVSSQTTMDMVYSHSKYHDSNTTLYPDTSTCLNCHAKDNTVGGQSLLAVHKKNSASTVTCDSCHATTARQAVKDAIAAKNVSCQACHGNTGHNHNVPVTGFATVQNVDCSSCHATGPNNVTELETLHRQAAVAGKIANYSCAICHNSTLEGYNKVITDDHKLDMLQWGQRQIYCDWCHSGATGYAPTAETGHKAEHTAVSTDTTVSCAGCHTASAWNGNNGQIANLHTSGCNTCHTSSNSIVSGFVYNGVGKTNNIYTCETCHTSGGATIKEVKHQPEHKAKYSNTDWVCSSCHSFSLTSGTEADISTIHKNGCNTCHGTTVRSAVKQFIASRKGLANPVYNCEDCHAVHTFDVQPLAKTTECLQCHAGGAPTSAKHSIIPMAQSKLQNAVNVPGSGWFLNGTTSLNSSPTNIHSNHAGSAWTGDLCIECHRVPACSDCHNNVTHGSHGTTGIPGIPAAAQQANCSTCHQSLPNVVKTNPDTTPLCTNCHANHNVSSTGFSPDPQATCNSCHATSADKTSAELDTIHRQAANAGKIVNYSCNTCHNQKFNGVVIGDGNFDMMRNGKPIYCADCHDGIKAPAANHKPDHKSTSDLAVTCSGCHNGTTAKGSFNTHNQVVDVSQSTIHPTCGTCHNSTNPVVKNFIQANLGQDTAVYKCDVCHDSIVTKHNINHSVKLYTNQFDPMGSNQDGHCIDCHKYKDVTIAHDIITSKQKMDCDWCHGPNPTYKDTPGVVKSNLSNNPLRAGYTCQDCHPAATLRDHVHGIAPGGFDPKPETDCSTCHANGSTYGNGELYTTHYNAHNDAKEYINPFGCYTCHNSTFEGSVITKDNVLSMNGIYCGTCHNGTGAPVKETLHKPTHTSQFNGTDQTCNSCHGFPATGANADISSTVIHKDGCLTCHSWNTRPEVVSLIDNIISNRRGGRVPPQPTCETCHGPNVYNGHKHSVAANGYDAAPNVDCSSCHATNSDNTAELMTVHQNAATAGKIINFRCSTCHNATFEGAGKPIVKDGVLDMKQNGTTSIYCADCHNGTLADALGTKYPAHNGNHINSTGYGTYKGIYNGLAFDDSAADCSKCHTSLDTKTVHDPVVHQNISCNSCHQSTNSEVQAVIAGAWSRTATKTAYTCSSCHSTLPYKHQPEHTATSADYATLDCSGCHSSAAWTNANAKLTDVHNNNCNLCHASTNSVVNTFIAGKQGQANAVYSCEGCHTTGGAQTKETVHKPEHQAKHSAVGMNCSSCHSFNLKAGDVSDISTIHKNGCATCHSATAPDNVKLVIAMKKGQANAVYSCEDCHSTIHLGWDAKHKPVFPTVANLNCVDCHDNYLPNEHQKALTATANTAIAYQVFRSTSSAGPWTLDGSTTATGYADTGLAANTTYYYKVKAYDGKPNYSGDSSVVSAKTLSGSAVLSTVDPDAANYASGNNGDSSADPTSTTNVLSTLTDNSNSTYSTLTENGSSDRYVIVKINQDAGDYNKVELKLTVRYYNSTNLQIYPYTNDTTINTASQVDGAYRYSSSNYITETIDVTAAAKTMSGKGWMKFRIKPDSSRSATIYLANVQINLTQNPVSGGTATNPSGTLTAAPNDTTAPTAPAGLTANSNYYDRVDLTWTASTDTSGTNGDVCAVCHNAAASQQVKDAIATGNAACSACHTIHTDATITAAHTGNALPTTPWACAKCHSNVLSLEHSANATLKQNGLSGLSCATCHGSTSTKVQAAIHSTATDKSNLACGACHTGTADGVPAVHTDIASPHLTGIFPTASDADCLNCHTTQAGEFTATKLAYHVVNPLASKAAYGWGTYLTPWTSASTVGCKGCHGNNNDGKAQAANILKRSYTYMSNSNQTDMVCYLCHDRNSYGGGSDTTGKSGFSNSGKNYHNIGDHKPNGILQCSWCHSAVPHGTNKAHLIVTKTDANSSGNLLTNYYHPASGQYQKEACGSDASNCGDHKGY